MSGTDDTGEDAPFLLAAEYVLGTLDAADARRAEQLAETDAGFLAERRFWEDRLFPLTALAAPVSPPETLWARIEQSLAAAGRPAPPIAANNVAANNNALRVWQGLALAGYALAAGLVAFIVLHPPARQANFAVLAPAGVTTPILVAFTQVDGAILVRPTAAVTVPSGRDLQLWSLAAGATRPLSLGVLPAVGKRVPQTLALGTQLLVSLEPAGGSPTGLPTGPVVYGGTLTQE